VKSENRYFYEITFPVREIITVHYALFNLAIVNEVNTKR
jgi:hypothetical protein